MIRTVTVSDSAQIAEIYNHYVQNTIVSFEQSPLSTNEMGQRIEAVIASGLPWLVQEENGKLIGYAYAAPWKQRQAYRYTAEVSVYLRPSSRSRGVGTRLYQALFSALKESDIHTVVSGIALPNEASVSLHEKFGMTKSAHFTQVGFKFDSWVDVGYWQGMLSELLKNP